MKILALIPARSGSKRLKNKNIIDFSGKPLIYWTIEEALKAPRIDKIIISTDDEKIQSIAETYGVHVPYLRPKEFSTDDATAFDVAMHEISLHPGYTHLLYLQPTSPLRTAKDIEDCISFFLNRKAKSVLSVSKIIKKNEWSVSIDHRSRIIDLGSHIEPNKRFCPNGAIYLCKIDWLMSSHTFVNDQTFAFVMPEERSIDIDEFSEYIEAQNKHNHFLQSIIKCN